jgi:hypothetical protein
MDHMEGIFLGSEKIKEMLENFRETPRRYGPCSLAMNVSHRT